MIRSYLLYSHATNFCVQEGRFLFLCPFGRRISLFCRFDREGVVTYYRIANLKIFPIIYLAKISDITSPFTILVKVGENKEDCSKSLVIPSCPCFSCMWDFIADYEFTCLFFLHGEYDVSLMLNFDVSYP